MARRVAFTAGVIIICVALQFRGREWVAIGQVKPDLLLAVTVVMGLWSGPRAGMAVGFTAGVLEGALLDRGIGPLAATRTIVGYLAGTIGRRVFAENLLVVGGAAAGLALAQELMVDVLTTSMRLSPLLAYLGRALYSGVAALVLGLVLRRARRWLPREEVEP